MMVERSSLTMIRWTPVCGPPPVRYFVSDAPDGCRIVNATVVGCPGRTGPAGRKPTRSYFFAGAMSIVFEPEEDEQPATTGRTSRSAASRRTRSV
jgi:hypothetical protein